MSDINYQSEPPILEEPQIINFCHVRDKRGGLAFAELVDEIPFDVRSVYRISNMPEAQKRGGHAYRTEDQLIVCIQGGALVKLTSRGGQAFIFDLSEPNKGLLTPPMWWGEMGFYNTAVLLGFSSQPFDEADYIRNRTEFK